MGANHRYTPTCHQLTLGELRQACCKCETNLGSGYPVPQNGRIKYCKSHQNPLSDTCVLKFPPLTWTVPCDRKVRLSFVALISCPWS